MWAFYTSYQPTFTKMFSIKSPFPEIPKEVLGEIGRILKFFVLTVKKILIVKLVFGIFY